MFFHVKVNENSKKDGKVIKGTENKGRQRDHKRDGKTTECKVKRKTGKGEVRTE